MKSYVRFCLLLCISSAPLAYTMEGFGDIPFVSPLMAFIPNPAGNDAPISIGSLIAAHGLPEVDEEGYLDLSNMGLASTDGMQEVPQQEHVLSLNLAHNLLTSSPAYLFAHLTSLDMSHNPIGTLNPGMLDTLPLLRKFYARNINLEDISPSFFAHLPRIRTIDLSGNNLSTLPSQLLQHNATLTALYLHTNHLTAVHPLALQTLTNLKLLDLANNRLQSLPLCTTLSKLKCIDASNNQLVALQPRNFDALAKLQKAFFACNKLSHIDPNMFRYCTQLTELNLAHNQLTQLPAQVVKPLIALRALNVRGNAPELRDKLSEDTVRLMKERSLFVGDPLLVDDTRIERTVKNLFEAMRKENRMHEIIYPDRKREGFLVINLSHQQLTSIDDLLAEIKEDVPDLAHVSTVLAQNNYLTILSCKVLNRFPLLSTLMLRSNLITSLVEEDPADRTNRYATPHALYLPYLTQLELSDNKITSIPRTALHYVPELTCLKLDRNELALIQDGAFQELENLRYCSLSNNTLTALPAALFDSSCADLRRLELLDLSHNQLGSEKQYTFPEHTRVHYYPQSAQPLLVLAAQHTVRVLEAQKPEEKLATLRTLPFIHKNPLAAMAPDSLRKYLLLHARINACMHAFEKIETTSARCEINAQRHKQAHEAENTWLGALADLEKEKWDEGLALFLDQMAPLLFHRLCMQRLCNHTAEIFQSGSLTQIDEIMKVTLPQLRDHYLNATSPGGLERIAQAQEVHTQYQEVVSNWHKKKRAIIMVHARAMHQAINLQAEIDQINKAWSDEFENFRAKLHTWTPEMQHTFFLLTNTKLKNEMAAHGVQPLA